MGKTTLLLELAEGLEGQTVYAAADAPEAALPGFWERMFVKAEEIAADQEKAVIFLDEAHLLQDWAAKLKSYFDRYRRKKTPIHIVATGSSALRLFSGSRETLAGRFERLTLTHWSASSFSQVLDIEEIEAAEFVVRKGSYPGAYQYRDDLARWSAYVRDAILEPAIGRDILALSSIRRPALLRQVFGIAASSPTQILSLQKIQGQLQDRGALETIANYLRLLEEAYLVAPVMKYAERETRRRSSPPKLVVLNNALVAIADSDGASEIDKDPRRLGTWIENACLAHAWNAGQRLYYWREEPLEADGIIEGSWGKWAIEVKSGKYQIADLKGLLEFVRRHPKFRPLVICVKENVNAAKRAGIDSITWQEFLLKGPPGLSA
ncbi:MAG: AAA family ATPase [Candidatus Eisenbacteria bacterium]|nr:AAA family ATPase [Candidatus Eisenbacteria bacterium]MBU1950035.1 AAA family ATPase [Candidatus Eisenbacteria bacterium]